MTDYETGFKALCFILDKAFSNDTYCFNSFEDEDKEFLQALIQGIYNSEDEEQRKDYRHCYYKVKELTDEINYKNNLKENEEEVDGR